MPDDMFRIEIDYVECAAMLAELQQHVERLGEEEVARLLGIDSGEVDVRRFYRLELEKNKALVIPTKDFRVALATLAAA